MPDKITLDNISSGFQLSKVNANFQKIEDEFNNRVLYRDVLEGEENQLEDDVDANGFTIYNVPLPTLDHHVVPKKYLDDAINVNLNPLVLAAQASAEAAAVSEENAAASESNAAQSAIEALASEEAAAISAQEAADSAAAAAVFDPSFYLAKTDNLSSLSDVAQARTNLGLGTAAVADSADFATAAQGALADSSLQADDIGVSVQEQLVSGTNIKTLGGQTLLGSGDVPLPENPIRQRVVFETGAYASGTTAIPNDDTIPQNTEGTQFMSASITPTTSDSVLVIEVLAHLANTNGNYAMIGALFKDSDVDAIIAARTGDTFTISAQLRMIHSEVAGSTTAREYKFRAGVPAAVTVGFNGYTSRLLGGSLKSSIRITEYAP